MKVTLINESPVQTPVVSKQGSGLVDTLEPATPFAIDSDEYTIVTIGDNPSIREDFADFIEHMAGAFIRLITFWREHAPRTRGKTAPMVKVYIDVSPEGPGVRVMLGDDRALDYELAPGGATVAEAPDYVELRELGV